MFEKLETKNSTLVGMVIRVPDIPKPMVISRITSHTYWLVEPDNYPNGQITTVPTSVHNTMICHISEWRKKDVQEDYSKNPSIRKEHY